jgi:hypothetical protein
VSVKTPIWGRGLPLDAFKKLPVMVPQSSRQLMAKQVATVLSLKKPTQGDCPQQHQDDAGVLVGFAVTSCTFNSNVWWIL